MPAVSELFGVGRALLATSRIIASAIPTNDLNPWVLNQPLRKRFGLPIRQKVYGHPLLQINQDRAKGNPAPKREVIHAQHARRWVRSVLGSMQKTQKRVGTGG